MKKEKDFVEAETLAAQPDTVQGYQYAPGSGKFIGEYTIHNNKDKKEVHLPPHTVLVAPPVAPAGQSAFWRNGEWVLDQTDEIKIFSPEDPVEPVKLSVPVFKKVMKDKPGGKPGEKEEVIEIEREEVTIEGEQQKAADRRAAFEAQQRAWGLMK